MYDEYVATKAVWKNGTKTGEVEITAQWKPAAQGGKPSVMLAKVAEAQAWRVTFPERFGGFYAPEEFEKDRAEQSPGENPGAAKRREAYAAAQAAGAEPIVVEATVGEAPVSESPYDGDRDKPLLRAELDEQAEILGRSVADLCERWSASRGGRAIDTASVDEMADHVHRIRPYVLSALRDQNRADEADRYEQAPPVGTCEELFGRGPVVVDPPVEAAAQAEESAE